MLDVLLWCWLKRAESLPLIFVGVQSSSACSSVFLFQILAVWQNFRSANLFSNLMCFLWTWILSIPTWLIHGLNFYHVYQKVAKCIEVPICLLQFYYIQHIFGFLHAFCVPESLINAYEFVFKSLRAHQWKLYKQVRSAVMTKNLTLSWC